ncbi:hypothetical protein [Kaistella jeonii]|uniref:hypothetical protein n=1 Tax=Kaistella jeonii TaxID=266749 RepID=UPI00068E9091|nr:hypothetical protein [Kaistella jeonii]SFC31057.1 hypothetical protein SAMN05421876_11319 [Kaistella jeonii]VEI95583.1 Uncharacterised protein [Kaistella jeonii]
MKELILTILFLFQIDSFAQTKTEKYNFNNQVIEVRGDLNKDNLVDKVIVTQDTLNENAPYRLQVFFKEPSGAFKLIVTSTKLIEPQYPNGRNGWVTGNGFSDITIKNGVLSVNFELLRGHFEHKFRFQNGNFELIGFSYGNSDGQGVITTSNFNLSTGIRIEKSERYDTDKILSNTKKKILIRPLPKLQDVIPMENELY